MTTSQSKQPYHRPQFSVYGSVVESTLEQGLTGAPDGGFIERLDKIAKTA